MSLKKTTIAALLAAAGMAVSSASMAQAKPADTGFYAGVSIGQTSADVDCAGTTSCDDSDSAWKIFGGYQINRNFAVELGYTDLGKISASLPPIFFPGVGTFASNLSIDTTAFELVGVGSYPVNQNFSLYGKIGLYRADSDVKVTLTGGPSVTNSDTNTDLTFGLGVRYDFTRNLGVRAEWQRYSSVKAGSTDQNADLDVLGIGVLWKF